MSYCAKIEPGSDQAFTTFVKKLGHSKFTWTLPNAAEVVEYSNGVVTSPEFHVTLGNLGVVTFRLSLAHNAKDRTYKLSLVKEETPFRDVSVMVVLTGATAEPIKSSFHLHVYKIHKQFPEQIPCRGKCRFDLDLTVFEMINEPIANE